MGHLVCAFFFNQPNELQHFIYTRGHLQIVLGTCNFIFTAADAAVFAQTKFSKNKKKRAHTKNGQQPAQPDSAGALLRIHGRLKQRAQQQKRKKV